MSSIHKNVTTSVITTMMLFLASVVGGAISAEGEQVSIPDIEKESIVAPTIEGLAEEESQDLRHSTEHLTIQRIEAKRKKMIVAPTIEGLAEEIAEEERRPLRRVTAPTIEGLVEEESRNLRHSTENLTIQRVEAKRKKMLTAPTIEGLAEEESQDLRHGTEHLTIQRVEAKRKKILIAPTIEETLEETAEMPKLPKKLQKRIQNLKKQLVAGRMLEEELEEKEEPETPEEYYLHPETGEKMTEEEMKERLRGRIRTIRNEIAIAIQDRIVKMKDSLPKDREIRAYPHPETGEMISREEMIEHLEERITDIRRKIEAIQRLATLESDIEREEETPEDEKEFEDAECGDRGPQIVALQRFLNRQGFTLATGGPGSAGKETDFFGPLTLKALKAFQTAEMMEPNGILDIETYRAIKKKDPSAFSEENSRAPVRQEPPKMKEPKEKTDDEKKDDRKTDDGIDKKQRKNEARPEVKKDKNEKQHDKDEKHHDDEEPKEEESGGFFRAIARFLIDLFTF